MDTDDLSTAEKWGVAGAVALAGLVIGYWMHGVFSRKMVDLSQQ